MRIVQLLGQEKFNVELNPGKSIKVIELMDEDPEESEVKSDVILDIDNGDWVENHTENEKRSVNRVLHLECGNMFDVKSLSTADVVMMETDIPSDLYLDLQKLLSSMHESARILTYLDLRRIWDLGPLPFKQLDCNRHLSDRYPTSWSVQRGHHFYLWSKVSTR